jgi:hypothetical protein
MRTLVIALCLTAIPAMADDLYTFTVPDAVTVSSAAGVETGWGYSLHNESSSLWLVTTDLSAGTFQHATPNVLFGFPDLGPGATVTLPYDPLMQSGLYQIAWDSNAPVGFVNAGQFTLTAQWWNGDPLAGGSFVKAAPNAIQPYSATVTPEPSTAGLSLAFLAVFGAAHFLRRRRAASLGLETGSFMAGSSIKVAERHVLSTSKVRKGQGSGQRQTE